MNNITYILAIIAAGALLGLGIMLGRGCNTPAEPVKETNSHSETRSSHSSESVTPNTDTLVIEHLVFREIYGRDTTLASDIEAIKRGLAAGSFNFHSIQPALGRHGNDTVSGVADAFNRRILNLQLGLAPLLHTHYDTLRTFIDSVVIKDSIVKHYHQAINRLSAKGTLIYDIASEKFRLNTSVSYRYDNIELSPMWQASPGEKPWYGIGTSYIIE